MEEIRLLYRLRWHIECFFKASKSFMKLDTESQSRNYTAMVSHTAIVFTRYIIPEWIHRNENDVKTYGELFFTLCEAIQDMDLTQVLQSLKALFMEQVNNYAVELLIKIHYRMLVSAACFYSFI